MTDSNTALNFLFVFNKAPHSTPSTKEGLDALLTASAFGQNVTLLLLGDGVFQAIKNQDPSGLPTKNTAAIFQSLDMYGVESIVTLDKSLQERGLTLDDISIPCSTLTPNEVKELYSTQHKIFTF